MNPSRRPGLQAARQAPSPTKNAHPAQTSTLEQGMYLSRSTIPPDLPVSSTGLKHTWPSLARADGGDPHSKVRLFLGRGPSGSGATWDHHPKDW